MPFFLQNHKAKNWLFKGRLITKTKFINNFTVHIQNDNLMVINPNDFRTVTLGEDGYSILIKGFPSSIFPVLTPIIISNSAGYFNAGMLLNGSVSGSLCYFSNFSRNLECAEDSLITSMESNKNFDYSSSHFNVYPNPIKLNETLKLNFKVLSTEKNISITNFRKAHLATIGKFYLVFSFIVTLHHST